MVLIEREKIEKMKRIIISNKNGSSVLNHFQVISAFLTQMLFFYLLFFLTFPRSFGAKMYFFFDIFSIKEKKIDIKIDSFESFPFHYKKCILLYYSNKYNT